MNKIIQEEDSRPGGFLLIFFRSDISWYTVGIYCKTKSVSRVQNTGISLIIPVFVYIIIGMKNTEKFADKTKEWKNGLHWVLP